MCYKNLSGRYTIEQVDCTVYTFALFNHAVQIFDRCVYYECVYFYLSPPLSPYCAPHIKGFLTLVNVFGLEKY